MGQRLVVNVTKGSENIASLYFHWSAYTVSTLQEVYDIGEYLMTEITENYNAGLESVPIEELQLALIRYAELNGGGIDGGKDSKEWEFITNKFPNEKFKEEPINRNSGLIAISKEGIEDLNNWGEGCAWLDVESLDFGTDVYWEHEMTEGEKVEDFTEVNGFPYNRDVYYAEIPDMINKLCKAEDNGFVFSCDGMLFDIIA